MQSSARNCRNVRLKTATHSRAADAPGRRDGRPASRSLLSRGRQAETAERAFVCPRGRGAQTAASSRRSRLRRRIPRRARRPRRPAASRAACRVMSVASPISSRSVSTALGELLALAPRSRGGPARRSARCARAIALQRLRRQLRLVDRLLGHGRCALLDLAHAPEPRIAATTKRQSVTIRSASHVGRKVASPAATVAKQKPSAKSGERRRADAEPDADAERRRASASARARRARARA